MASSAARGSEKKQPLGRISHLPSTLGPSVLNYVYCLPQQQAHIHLPDRSLRQQHKLAQIGHSKLQPNNSTQTCELWYILQPPSCQIHICILYCLHWFFFFKWEALARRKRLPQAILVCL